MGDDNPLWYDYAEPAEPPGRMLLALVGLVSVMMSSAAKFATTIGRPDVATGRATMTSSRFLRDEFGFRGKRSHI